MKTPYMKNPYKNGLGRVIPEEAFENEPTPRKVALSEEERRDIARIRAAADRIGEAKS